MKQYHWGLVGLGEIAQQFAAGFQNENSSIQGVTSRSVEKAQQFAQTHHIPQVYATYEEMLADPTIDIIYVAVPNKQHIDYILPALHAKKHVLCEKAITVTQAELQQAMQLAQENDLILAEAMTIFHMPLYQELRRRIDQGQFGALKMIQAPFGSYKEPDPLNRFFNPDLAGGALLDIGTYAVSFARYFLTSQPTVLASTMVPFHTGVDESSVTILKNERDELATVSLSFQAKMPKQGIVAFENAYVVIDNYPRAEQALIYFNDGTTETIVSGASEQALNYEVAAMIAMITGEKPNQGLFLTNDVLAILDDMRAHWQTATAP